MNKKSQGLPVNIIVTVIIGIVIFGLGMGLFTSISNSGEDEINRLNEQVRTGITSLECDGGDWICSPAYEINNGEGRTLDLYVANKGDENQQFNVEFLNIDFGEGEIEKSGCGKIVLNYLEDLDLNVLSGESAKVPVYVKATQVTKIPCSFIATAILKDESDDEVDRTSVIIKIK